MKIQFDPLEKAVLVKIEIFFGMVRKDVEKLIGAGEKIDNRSYYFNSCLMLEYNEKNQLVFLECSQGIGTVMIDDIDIFHTKAGTVKEYLAQKNGTPPDETEIGYEAYFPALSVGLYRDITPDDAAGMIQEIIQEGRELTSRQKQELENDTYRAGFGQVASIGMHQDDDLVSGQNG